jgi:hypothetical protein
MAREGRPARGSADEENFQFGGPPQIGGGLGLAGLLKLAGYGERDNELDQYKLLFNLMQNQAEQAKWGRQEEREGRKETREGAKTQSDIEAATLKSQIDMLNLQRQIQEMQQKAQQGELDALVDLAKTGDKTALAALPKASKAYAEAKAGEHEATSKWRAGEMEGQLLPLYQGGKRKELATQMALNEPEFKLNPDLVKLVNWQRLAQEWPVEPATPRPDATTASVPSTTGMPPAMAWRYGTGTLPAPLATIDPQQVQSFYEGGGPSAMPGQIDPNVLRLISQQNAPPARIGQTPSTFRYGTGTMEVPEVAQPTGSGMSMGDFLAATVPGSGMSSPEAIRAALRIFETREPPSTEPYRVGY